MRGLKCFLAGAGTLVSAIACSGDPDPVAPALRALLNVTCPPQYQSCTELNSSDITKIYARLDEIDAEATDLNCGFIRETIEELLEAQPPRLSKASMSYAGWAWTDSLGVQTIAIDPDTFDSVYELFWTLVHEPRHLRGEGHPPEEDEFDDYEDFLLDGCSHWQDPS